MHRHTLQRNSSEQRSRAAGPLSAACEENGQIVMLHVNMCTCVQKQHFVFETHHNLFREFDPVQPDKTDEWICLHVTSTNVFFLLRASQSASLASPGLGRKSTERQYCTLLHSSNPGWSKLRDRRQDQLWLEAAASIKAITTRMHHRKK